MTRLFYGFAVAAFAALLTPQTSLAQNCVESVFRDSSDRGLVWTAGHSPDYQRSYLETGHQMASLYVNGPLDVLKTGLSLSPLQTGDGKLNFTNPNVQMILLFPFLRVRPELKQKIDFEWLQEFYRNTFHGATQNRQALFKIWNSWFGKVSVEQQKAMLEFLFGKSTLRYDPYDLSLTKAEDAILYARFADVWLPHFRKFDEPTRENILFMLDRHNAYLPFFMHAHREDIPGEVREVMDKWDSRPIEPAKLMEGITLSAERLRFCGACPQMKTGHRSSFFSPYPEDRHQLIYVRGTLVGSLKRDGEVLPDGYSVGDPSILALRSVETVEGMPILLAGGVYSTSKEIVQRIKSQGTYRVELSELPVWPVAFLEHQADVAAHHESVRQMIERRVELER